MTHQEKHDLQSSFLKRWPLEKIKAMTLEDYVIGSGSTDSYCYWLEVSTRLLGSIYGVPAGKFGIYKRKQKEKASKLLATDGKYNWRLKFGSDRDTAFTAVKGEILNVVDAAQRYDLEQIDNSELHSFLKWKIASLYSNGKIFPVFSHEAL